MLVFYTHKQHLKARQQISHVVVTSGVITRNIIRVSSQVVSEPLFITSAGENLWSKPLTGHARGAGPLKITTMAQMLPRYQPV